MASGFARFAKANSTHSLGSFVEIASAASSEFEPIDLEELELAPNSSEMTSKDQGTSVLGKNTTPAPATIPSTHTPSIPETLHEDDEHQASIRQIVDPLQDGLQNFEQATQKAAEAAKDFTSKLWVSSTAEAKSSVMRLAGDVSSWWATLDPSTTSEQPQDSHRSAQGNEEVQELFSLGSSEELMERFSCTLTQTVQCTHNSFSEPQQVKLPGKLYITNKHTCFEAEGCKFAIPHADVRKVSRGTGPRSQSLHLELSKYGEYVDWEGFRGSDLESALGLLEHLTT